MYTALSCMDVTIDPTQSNLCSQAPVSRGFGSAAAQSKQSLSRSIKNTKMHSGGELDTDKICLYAQVHVTDTRIDTSAHRDTALTGQSKQCCTLRSRWLGVEGFRLHHFHDRRRRKSDERKSRQSQ